LKDEYALYPSLARKLLAEPVIRTVLRPTSWADMEWDMKLLPVIQAYFKDIASRWKSVPNGTQRHAVRL